jgi:hypothetical protein
MEHFRTTVELGGKTATGLPVPAEVVAELSDKKRVAVIVTLNGHTYRSTITPMGERFMIPLSAENREAAGVQAGDQVEVAVEVDNEPREVAVPEALAKALGASPVAQGAFDRLSYSNRLRHVLAVDSAKTDETRQRRIAKILEELGG